MPENRSRWFLALRLSDFRMLKDKNLVARKGLLKETAITWHIDPS